MESLNIDPNAAICLEVYSTFNGKPETITIGDLNYKQAYEYFTKMEPDTDFQFFRVWPDGSHTDIEFV